MLNKMNENGKKYIWVLAAALIVAASAAGIWHWGRPAYQRAKENRLQKEAQTFLDHGDYRNALMSARLTLMLNASNIPACRILASLSELSQSPAALDWRKRIAELEPTPENKLALAAAALQFENPPFPLATEILDQLAGTATNLAAYYSLATMRDLKLNRLPDAEQHMMTALQLEPANRSFAMNLAVLRIHATNPATAAAARATLEQFVTDTNLGPAALRSLIAGRILRQDYPGARDYSTQLLAGPAANLGDQLQYLNILNTLADPAIEATLRSVQQQAATNAMLAAQVAGWMEGNGRMQSAAGWLRSLPAEVQAQPPVQIALAEYQMGTTNWTELCRLTARGNWDEMDFLRLAFLSRAWEELGEPLVAESHWRSALDQTEGKLGALNMLLNFSGRWGKPAAQESLLNRIVNRHPDATWARRALEQLYLNTGNTPKLYQLYTALVASAPENIGAKNNLTATALLLKTNLPQAGQWAREIYAQHPGDPVIVSTYAYALHLEGRDQEGLAALQRLSAEQLNQPSVALYYGVLLRATGQREAAVHFLASAEKAGNLLPEEKALITGTAKSSSAKAEK